MCHLYTKHIVHYKDSRVIDTVSQSLINYLPVQLKEVIIVCIGTDRSTGDALGPLTGTILSTLNIKNVDVFGTLHDPVHALNLTDTINNINDQYRDPFIIAIDASLGSAHSVGDLIFGKGAIKPGLAVKKDLPQIGDLYITGVVNMGGFMEYTILQCTRLSIVHDMANTIAKVIQKIDRCEQNKTIRNKFHSKTEMRFNINN